MQPQMMPAEIVTNLPAISNESQALLSVIERVAMSPDADISKLEKMLELQERIMNRQAYHEYSASMAAMQADMPEIQKNGAITVNGVVRSKYATFEDINEQVRPVLQKHGFAVTFRVRQIDSTITVTGVLCHISGHHEETDIVLHADTTGSKNAVQAIGSAISYGRRYALCALLNITTRGEDDDGQSAGAKQLTPFQESVLMDVLGECTPATREWFATTYTLKTPLTRDGFDSALAKLKKAREAAKGSAA